MLKKSNTKVMILAVAVGVIIGISFIVSAKKSTPEKTLIKYTKALEKGDKNKIKKLLAPEMRLLFEGASIFMDNISNDLNNAKKKVIVDEIIYGDDKNTAEVKYYIISESKEDYKIDKDYETVDMIKLKGKWYINMDLSW